MFWLFFILFPLLGKRHKSSQVVRGGESELFKTVFQTEKNNLYQIIFTPYSIQVYREGIADQLPLYMIAIRIFIIHTNVYITRLLPSQYIVNSPQNALKLDHLFSLSGRKKIYVVIFLASLEMEMYTVFFQRNIIMVHTAKLYPWQIIPLGIFNK